MGSRMGWAYGKERNVARWWEEASTNASPHGQNRGSAFYMMILLLIMIIYPRLSPENRPEITRRFQPTHNRTVLFRVTTVRAAASESGIDPFSSRHTYMGRDLLCCYVCPVLCVQTNHYFTTTSTTYTLYLICRGSYLWVGYTLKTQHAVWLSLMPPFAHCARSASPPPP